MNEIVFLDTHVVVWLYDKLLKKFSSRASHAIENNELRISPIVMLELEYLFEIERIQNNSVEILEYLEDRINLRVDDRVNISRWFITSLQEKWTRDPFDRLIVSHAKLKACPLVSKDHQIHKHYLNTVW